MGTHQVSAESSGAIGLDDIVRSGVRTSPDVGVFATKTDRGAAVLLWHYHDDDVSGPQAAVDLTFNGAPASGRALVRQSCINEHSSNSYAAWQRMGSPQTVSPAQYAALERAAALASCGAPAWRTIESGTLTTRVEIPRQGVSLVEISW